MKLPPFLTSSINPEALSLTVKGILVSILPIVIALAGLTHINLGPADLTSGVDAITNVVFGLSTALSALMVIIGLVRKVGVALGFMGPVKQ